MPSTMMKRLFGALSAAWADMRRRQRIARAVAELERYEDLMLRDVGIPRGRIREVVEGINANADRADPSGVVFRTPPGRSDHAKQPEEHCVLTGCCGAA